MASAALVREVRLLRKAREISEADMRVLLGLEPRERVKVEMPEVTEEDRKHVREILADWRKNHPERHS